MGREFCNCRKVACQLWERSFPISGKKLLSCGKGASNFEKGVSKQSEGKFPTLVKETFQLCEMNFRLWLGNFPTVSRMGRVTNSETVGRIGRCITVGPCKGTGNYEDIT